MQFLHSQIAQLSPVAVVIISISLMLASGVFVSRLTGYLHLPNVTAYILTGLLLGPCCLDLVPAQVIASMSFISDLALAFIAFSAGEYFRLSVLRGNGLRITAITLFETLVPLILVFILTYFILQLGLPFSIILSALASATASASTLVTIRQTEARGPFVNDLLSVIALDNVISLLAFSVAVSVAICTLRGGFTSHVIMKPLLLNLLMLLAGYIQGKLLKYLMGHHTTDNRLIIAIAILLTLCGLGAALGVSPLLGCMVIGMVYINTTDDDMLFKQVNYFAPPILLLFFVKSGLGFHIEALLDTKHAIAGVKLLVIGLTYFTVRIFGKYLGAYWGGKCTRSQPSLTQYLGLALIPQAGVAIGLAELGSRLLGGENGSNLLTIILATSILYELCGPVCAKLSLHLAGAYEENKMNGASHPMVEPLHSQQISTLTQRLQNIQEELKQYARSPEELAFVQAAEESEHSTDSIEYRRRRKIGRFWR